MLYSDYLQQYIYSNPNYVYIHYYIQNSIYSENNTNYNKIKEFKIGYVNIKNNHLKFLRLKKNYN